MYFKYSVYRLICSDYGTLQYLSPLLESNEDDLGRAINMDVFKGPNPNTKGYMTVSVHGDFVIVKYYNKNGVKVSGPDATRI